MGKIGQSFVSNEKVVLLIDEIDKADTDFQDDMLDVLDQMEFDIIEIDKTIKTFYRLREIRGIEKKPATRELINWIRALKADHDFRVKDLIKGEVPFLGVLFKKSPDYVVSRNT